MSKDSPSFDSVLALCQHQHRRIVLGTLAEEQRLLTLNDLSKAVLKHNHQMPITEASEEVLNEIRVSLHHAHLPKLAAEGLIHYDSERQCVEPTDQFEQVQPMLSTLLAADPTLEAPIKL